MDLQRGFWPTPGSCSSHKSHSPIFVSVDSLTGNLINQDRNGNDDWSNDKKIIVLHVLHTFWHNFSAKRPREIWSSDENESHNRKSFILYLDVKTIRSNRVKQHLAHFVQCVIAKHFTYWVCYLNWRFRWSSSRNFLNSLISPSRAFKRQHRRTHFHAHCTLWLRQSFAWAPHHHVFCTTLNGQGKQLLDNLFIFSAFNNIASPSLKRCGQISPIVCMVLSFQRVGPICLALLLWKRQWSLFSVPEVWFAFLLQTLEKKV